MNSSSTEKRANAATTKKEPPAKDPAIRKAPLRDPPENEPPRRDPPAGPPRKDPLIDPHEPKRREIDDPRTPGEPERIES